MDMLPCAAPAAYIPYHALAFSGPSNLAVAVGADHPLPVTATFGTAASEPLGGTASSSAVVGPFEPELGRAIWLTLSGTWSGSVTVKRSTDGGTTKLPLTLGGFAWGSFSGNANEPVAEETVAGATYYLDITIASGTLAYEVAQ